MSPDELKEIITQAIIEADIIRDKNIQNEIYQTEVQNLNTFQKGLGYKDYSSYKNRIVRAIKLFFNRIRIFAFLPFSTKYKNTNEYAIVNLFQGTVTAIIIFLGGILGVFSIIAFIN